MSFRPLALSNWKMAMSIEQSRSFARDLQVLLGELTDVIDVVLCPPYTALWPVKQIIADGPVQLGAQNVAATDDLARTGQISAALLSNVGCRWVMIGHWEVRNYLKDNDEAIRRKLRLSLDEGLQPIVLIGESAGEKRSMEEVINDQLEHLLDGLNPEEVNSMAFMYEPEAAIGLREPAAAERVSTGCQIIRQFLNQHGATDDVRVIYGGSVTPKHAAYLLQSPYVDGLAATRQGRDPVSFAEIVREIAKAKLNWS